MTELVTFGETMLRLSVPAGERLESADGFDCRTAGAESNVAIAAARLGTDAVWLSKLPASALGRRVAGDIRAHGVDVRPVWSPDGRQGTYYLEPGGEPRGTTVIYDRADAAVTTAEPAELDTDAVAAADVFLTTGITPALSETLFETTRSLLDRSSTAAFDLNYRGKLWSAETARAAYDDLLPAVDLLFAPERDARTVLGVEGSPEAVADSLRSQYDCETVVLTRGEDGALAHTGSEVLEEPVIEAETLEPVGTGDAFVGGFLSRYVRDESTATALEWGAATAALKRTIAGDVALVTEAEVRDVLDPASGGIDR